MATFVTNGGLAILTNRLKGSGTEPVYVGWGSGTGTTTRSDTTLFTEVDVDVATTASGTRTTGTTTRVTTSQANDTWQNAATRTSTGAGTITNAGCWDNSAMGSGSLFLKGDFVGIGLSSGDSIAFTIKCQFTN